MPRNCGCSDNACSCLVIPGPGIAVEGTGNSSSPYVVSLAPNQDRYDAGQVAVGGALDTRDVIVDTFVRAEALGAMFIRPPDAFGVEVNYYIVNSTNALITLLGTTFWQPAAPVMTSTRLWLTVINVQGGAQWIARGGAAA